MQQLAPSPSQRGLSQHGLVSLWEMLRFHADKFLSVLNHLNILNGALQGDVQDVWDKNGSYIAGRLDELIKQLDALGLNVSRRKAEGLKFMFVMPQPNAELAKRYIAELFERIEHELDGRLFYYFAWNADLYESPLARFGDQVGDTFKGSAEEIECAGKCLALGQGTACVFHLMRAMEASVKVLGSTLGINDVEKEWGKILSELKSKIETMPSGEHRDEWSACHSNLYHVKQAWRNPTMHPKKTYTPEQAEEVFYAVAAFMRHLATLVPKKDASRV